VPRSLLIGAAALTALSAFPACAQDPGDRPPLRRLEWAGRPAATAAEAGSVRTVIPHAGAEPARVALRPAQPWRPTSGSSGGRPGLTPASAFSSSPAAPAPSWTPPAAEVAPAPLVERRPAPAPQPIRTAEARPRPSAPAAATDRVPPHRPEPEPQARLVQPSPVSAQPQPQPQPQVSQPVAEAPLDPMAPRRDAPIFRVQGARQPTAPVVAPSSVAATEAGPAQPQRQAQAQASPGRQQGARYYSVHRQNGRAPDPTVLPEPVWLDRMPVDLDATPQSEDLAAPPEAPQMVRGSDGAMRPVQGAQHDPIP
jgi:hypothetical protein